MPSSTLTYVLSHIKQNIPPEILNLAFKPQKYNSTVEARIISEVIDSTVKLETNLVGGKKRDIILQADWELPFEQTDGYNSLGVGTDASFYKVPPEARENRNIAQVIGLTPSIVSSMPGSSANYNGTGSFGNTAGGMISEMLNTRTFAQYPIQPLVTLEGTNIIRVYPKNIVSGSSISVMLEYDSEFVNMNRSAIHALSKFALCAVQRYIYNTLRVSVDETQVVAGMEIGVIKDILNEYSQKIEQYDELLNKFKGAMHYDMKSLSRLAYYGL